MGADSRKRQRADLSFLSDMRLHCLLGGRRLSWIHRRCHRQLRRSEFPRADDRGVGGVTPPLALPAARHATQAHGEAGLTPNVRFALYPQKRTWISRLVMSALCHQQTWCDLFDHVVGPDPATGDYRRVVLAVCGAGGEPQPLENAVVQKYLSR